MTTQPVTTVPSGFPGSLPEWVAIQALDRLGKQGGVHYVYQSSFQGGRLDKGGLVIDFLFVDPPDLAINIQGEFYHQEQGAAVIARDKFARASLAGEGITLIFIDAEDLLADPMRYIQAALNYQDLSFLGGVGG